MFHMNINLSYVQLKKSDVLQELRNHLGVAEVCPENIMLEITESGYIETDPAFRKAMEEICGQKLRLAIDDFGTGYSNLRYLKDLRADMIKIDRSFAVRALESDYDYTLLGHIIEMAHSMACGCVWRVWKRKRSWCVYSGYPRVTFRDFYSAGLCLRGNLLKNIWEAAPIRPGRNRPGRERAAKGPGEETE